MKWRGRRQSSNVEDRRSANSKGIGGIGIGSILIALILWKVFGINPETTLGVAQQIQTTASTPATQSPSQIESYEFVATILADTEDVWSAIFQQAGQNYTPPL